MELYQLSYFLEVARQRNFTRAAERLRLAQPALSQQMKNLEAEFGTPLFVRGRKETHLTAAGEALLPRAEGLLAQAETARHAVAEVAALRGGRLAIATIPSISACWLPRVIQRFRERHPRVELRLLEQSSEGVAELVETHQAELGFLQLPISSERLQQRLVLNERFIVLVPKSHPLAGQASIRLAELAAESFVFYKGRARDTALAAGRQAGFHPRVACESGELETVRALVAAGLGVAIVPQLGAQTLPPNVLAVPLRAPQVRRQIGVIWIRRNELSPGAAAFLELLKSTSAAA